MHRRKFMRLIGGGVAAIPLTAAAQQAKMPHIGILALGTPDPAAFLGPFREGLRDLGYVEGQSVVFEFRSAKGSMALLPQLAAELVALKVDIIVGFQTPAVTAAKNATTEIPIVMGSAGDPVATGLVKSLARPGGNITGMMGAGADLGAKMLELVREVLPSIRRIAVLANAPDPFHKPFVQHIETAGRTLNLAIHSIPVPGPDGLEKAFAEFVAGRAEAVVVQPSLPQPRVAALALRHRLPAFAPNVNFPGAGGLLSYSADQPALYRQSTTFVDQILKGRKPADLPVQLPTKFLLVVNLKTAAALSLTVPPTLLVRADQVIE
jgi:putative ABC transport system substrate-binding protein